LPNTLQTPSIQGVCGADGKFAFFEKKPKDRRKSADHLFVSVLFQDGSGTSDVFS